MAKIYPNNIRIDNYGEKQLYKYLKEYLEYDDIAYYNYELNGMEFDFCILKPGRGILMVEVKGWLAENIKEVIDNNYIKYKINDEIKYLGSPYEQAKGYARIMWEKGNENKGRVKIIPVVCYPSISKSDYYKSGLNLISEINNTILKDDLIDKTGFNKKIDLIFREYSSERYDDFSSFREKEIFEIRKYFEKEESIIEDMKLELSELKSNLDNMREYYSLLSIVNQGCFNNDYLERYIELWLAGTKVIIIHNNLILVKKYKRKLKEIIEKQNLSSREQFQLDENQSDINIYNFSTFYVDMKNLEENHIIDGEIESVELEKKLDHIDKKSKFNLDQYLIEHLNKDSNIMVEAGAGTGKTYTMISRIMYLIYIENLNSKNLEKSVAMITFTNEAADSMKNKIKENLINYYLLTRDYKYFEMTSSVENMQISTIHSFILEAIKERAYKLGLGSNLEVTKGTLQRKQEVERSISKFIELNEDDFNKIMDNIDQEVYEVNNYILDLINKLENKNIDILNDKLDLGETSSENNLNESMELLIRYVIKDSESNLRKRILDQNKIKLSDLLISLREIVPINPSKRESFFKYIFIDEFQDTDNIQIETLSEIHNILNFKLFIVGDIKQSIYRFRGAEDDAFKRLQENGTNKTKWVKYSLYKNYRTYEDLLVKYDDIFKQWIDGENHFKYEEADRIKSNIGYLENMNYRIYEEIVIEENLDKELIDKILKEYQFIDREKKAGTIAILVRTNRELDQIISLNNSEELKGNLIIENSDRGDFYTIDPTIDFYKLILALINKNSPKYLYNLSTTNYMEERFNIGEIYNQKKKKGEKGVYDYLVESWTIKKWENYIEEFKHNSVLMVIRKIVSDIRPWEIYADKSGFSRNSQEWEYKSEYYKNNLEYLFEKITLSGDVDYITLNSIESFLKINIVSGIEEPSRTAEMPKKVRVICSTVHKAKGLEYDTVILPYTDFRMDTVGANNIIILEDNKIGYSFRQSKYKTLQNEYYIREEQSEKRSKISEELRILYVAMTRAERKLIYFTNSNSKNKYSWRRYLVGDLK